MIVSWERLVERGTLAFVCCAAVTAIRSDAAFDNLFVVEAKEQCNDDRP
jgi:hypothetical protein